MKLERDGFKTHFVTIFNIFRRLIEGSATMGTLFLVPCCGIAVDEKDEQKDRKCSRSYIEDFLRNQST